jgi:hypothetical protein
MLIKTPAGFSMVTALADSRYPILFTVFNAIDQTKRQLQNKTAL